MADFDWGKVLVGVVSAAGTMYASREQKKAQEKQYEYEKKLLDEQRQYQQQQAYAAQNTPAAKVAPYLMQAALQLYGDKLKKHGVNLPLEEIFSALGLGTGGTLSNSMMGGDGLTERQKEQRASLALNAAERFGGVREVVDPVTGKSILVANQMSTGKGGARTQYRTVDDSGGGISGFEGSGGGRDIFDQMFAAQHEYMRDQGMLSETLISPEQMANFNISAREFGNAHPLADKAGKYLFSSLLGAAMPGPTFGAGGLYNQLVKGDNANITDVYGDPNLWINGVPQYAAGDTGKYTSTPITPSYGVGG